MTFEIVVTMATVSIASQQNIYEKLWIKFEEKSWNVSFLLQCIPKL